MAVHTRWPAPRSEVLRARWVGPDLVVAAEIVLSHAGDPLLQRWS